MYLIFKSQQQATERNIIEAFRRGHVSGKTRFVWGVAMVFDDDRVALKVTERNGDVAKYSILGYGLTDEEISKCVKTLPIEEE